MRKILPLVALHETDNYLSNGVDAVLMGTNFGSKAQVIVYDLEEMMDTNEKLPVIGLFNRDFKESEQAQLLHEIAALYEGGLDSILITDSHMISVIKNLNLDIKLMYRTEAALTEEEILNLYQQGADEVILTQVSVVIPELEEKSNLGIHFFGKNFTHTHHEDTHFDVADDHGNHHYSHDVYSLIHAYETLKEKGLTTLYFESFGLDIDDVLFVVRSLDLIDDLDAFENLVYDTINIEMGHDHHE